MGGMMSGPVGVLTCIAGAVSSIGGSVMVRRSSWLSIGVVGALSIGSTSICVGGFPQLWLLTEVSALTSLYVVGCSSGSVFPSDGSGLPLIDSGKSIWFNS
jgi:hypothetical protein